MVRSRLALRRVPIADDDATKPHLALEVLVEYVVVRARVRRLALAFAAGALDQVVGTHHTRHTCFHRRFEWRVIDLEKGPLIDLFEDRVARSLDRVRHEMLRRLQWGVRNLPVRLHHGFHHLCAEIRILARHVLAEPPVPGESGEVDARAELAAARHAELLGNLQGPQLHDVEVPSGRHSHRARPTRRVALVPLVALRPVAPVAEAAH
mmetsp:Transcript_55623/g.169209  ORF Transcript_55623/g.169209 Transcript_55623/m.169209 type:complete len:208 (-) Transcript_55623:234-857(-)